MLVTLNEVLQDAKKKGYAVDEPNQKKRTIDKGPLM